MALRDIARGAVKKALREFQRLGPDAILEQYGGGFSTCWFIDRNGTFYDQKLTLRAAHELSGLGPLRPGPGTFTAGQARRHLKSLGFSVVRRDDRTPTGGSAAHSLPDERPVPGTQVAIRSRPRSPVKHATDLPPLSLADTLFVIPCSAAKRHDGGRADSAAASVLDCLPRPLAAESRARRGNNARQGKVDESTLLPATKRYNGHLYKAAGAAFDALDRAGANVLIVSGAYGVVCASEPIGWYEQPFRTTNWPNGLVGRCLAAYAQEIGARTVVGLLSATTGYKTAFHQTRWPEAIEWVFQVSPQRTNAAPMVKAPRAIGEALDAISRNHRLRAGWKSSDGLRIQVTKLR